LTCHFHRLTDFRSQVGAKDVTSDAAHTLHVFNLLKAVTFVTVPFMANLPAVRTSSLRVVSLSTLTQLFLQGVMVYLMTGVIAMTAQSLLLRTPSIRRTLDIPVIPDHARVEPPTFLETVKFGVEWYKKKSAEAAVQQRTQGKKKF